MSSLKTQVGGDHYTKLAIQPMQYSMANKLDACQHSIIKYVTRFRDKNGIADLQKARHCIDMLIEMEEKPAPGIEAAREAIREYNAVFKAGGEIEYPQWAADELKNAVNNFILNPRRGA